jgi:hypothetical protein
MPRSNQRQKVNIHILVSKCCRLYLYKHMAMSEKSPTHTAPMTPNANDPLNAPPCDIPTNDRRREKGESQRVKERVGYIRLVCIHHVQPHAFEGNESSSTFSPQIIVSTPTPPEPSRLLLVFLHPLHRMQQHPRYTHPGLLQIAIEARSAIDLPRLAPILLDDRPV